MAWRSRLSSAVNWLRSRKEVGKDGRHIFYSEYVGKGLPEKRYVEYLDGDLTDSSHGMKTEWWSWLHNRRDDPPSSDEIERSSLQAERLQQRVQILEDEDARQRLRQFGAKLPQTSAAEDVRRERVKERLMRGANENLARGGPGVMIPSSTETTEFEPESWTPNKKN